MKILLRSHNDNKWRLVESAGYDRETELQKLLADSPGLISIDEIRPGTGPLVLAVREFGLPIGSIDLLAFSAQGDIAVIECKLATNAEIKRKVIGQVLDYAANLWGMRYEDVDEIIRLRMGESLAELVEKAAGDAEWDEENFRSNVETALENGKFILMVVVDEINDELTRVVQYINVCGSPAFEFAALEMRRFAAEHSEMLVPRVIGPSHAAKPRQSSNQADHWDEPSFIAELQRRHGGDSTNAAQKILDWALQKNSVWWGKGKRSGSFVPYLFHNDRQHQLFAVWTYGVVEIYFYWYAFKPPFDVEEKRLELLRRLNQIPGIELQPESISRRPNISLTALTDEKAINQFLSIYDWVVEEILGS